MRRGETSAKKNDDENNIPADKNIVCSEKRIQFCNFSSVFQTLLNSNFIDAVYTSKILFSPKIFAKIQVQVREYARGRRERRNRFRPADVAFFSSESDKNVALIFRKIRCFNIHFNIHTCHQLVFDLGRSSTRYPSGLHKKIDTW